MDAIALSIVELQRWMPWASDGVPTVEDERAVFASGAASFDADADWGYSIVERATGELVGGCGLHPRDGHARLEIGYWVRSDRHGRGYATVAAQALVDACFRYVDAATRIEIRMDAANIASARVPPKIGFQFDGEEERPLLTSGHTGRGLIWSIERHRWRSATAT